MPDRGNRLVYQFKITLTEIEPPIWRRIQVPAKYSFWDLHVAIQDAMGWLDYHLHAFRTKPKSKKKPIAIGIPDDEFDDEVIIPGWKVSIGEYFTEPGQAMLYEYDFGDDWRHEVLFEGILLREKNVAYPRCLAGERSCPPEDCGGPPGYENLLTILRDHDHPEYEDYVEWLKGHAKNYWPYEPDKFRLEKIHFDNPQERWKMAFSEENT